MALVGLLAAAVLLASLGTVGTAPWGQSSRAAPPGPAFVTSARSPAPAAAAWSNLPPDAAAAPAAPVTAPGAAAPTEALTITVLSAAATPGSGAAPLVVTLSASAHGSANATSFTFNWTLGDGSPNNVTTVVVAANANASQSFNHTYGLVTAGVAVVYTAIVNVTDNVNDRFQTSHKVLVTVTPILALAAAANPPVVTLGRTVSLVPNATGGLAPYKFSWSGTPAGCVTGTVDLNCTTPTSGPFNVRVLLTDAAGNRNTTSVNFVVNPAIVLVAGIQSFFSCASGSGVLQENFTGNVTGGTPPYAYTWTFGDASAAQNGTRLSHVYAAAGNYTAAVTVNDSGGGRDNATLKVVATFPPCTGAPPPAWTVSATLVKGLVVLAFVVVIALALLVFFRRRRSDAAKGLTPWNKGLEPPTGARAASRPGGTPPRKPGAPPPPEEGTVQ